jgi:Swt1-like HEPN
LTNLVALRDWLFKALSVDDSLNRFEAEGLSVRNPSDIHALQRVLPLEGFSQELRGKAMKALPVYLGFFCLENAIRELIAERLTENHGSDWWDTCASQPIKNSVSSRQIKEGKNRWHIRRGDHEVYYTDFGDLKLLIQNNWADFQDLFPDQNWIAARLDELEASRNIIAHSNILEDREIDRIRLYLDDWQRQVG